MRSFLGRDILSVKQFEREEYMRIFQAAEELEPCARDRHNSDLLRHKTLVVAFFQPSTRTRISTEAAMHRLGGHVVGFADPTMTRAGDVFQETLADTVRMLESYGDVIAMRHPQTGAPAEAARSASIPVINCGDGSGEHPTQTLTDMFTILRTKGRLDGLRFALIGDMRLRTIHSLSYALCQFDIEAAFASPPDMVMTDKLRVHLRERGVRFREVETAEEAIVDADVIYVESTVHPAMDKGHDAATGQELATPEAYRITQSLLYEKGKSDALVLHSLPRRDEIALDVDPTRHCGYWVQASNGVLIRMALLALILGAME